MYVTFCKLQVDLVNEYAYLLLHTCQVCIAKPGDERLSGWILPIWVYSTRPGRGGWDGGHCKLLFDYPVF